MENNMLKGAPGTNLCSRSISSGYHILDLCAAPGAKLCMMLGLLGNSGSATAVDIAKHRITACPTMIQKYGLGVGDRCRLFVGDGTNFSIIPFRVHKNAKQVLYIWISGLFKVYLCLYFDHWISGMFKVCFCSFQTELIDVIEVLDRHTVFL